MWGLVRSDTTVGMSLEEVLRHKSFAISLCFLVMKRQVSSFTRPLPLCPVVKIFYMKRCLSIPIRNRADQPWTEASETVTQYKPALCKLFPVNILLEYHTGD